MNNQKSEGDTFAFLYNKKTRYLKLKCRGVLERLHDKASLFHYEKIEISLDIIVSYMIL